MAEILWGLGLVTAVFAGMAWWQRRAEQRLLALIEPVTVPDFASVHLGNQRPLTIYLPPDYHQSTAVYRSLYVNDGQDVASLQLRRTLATLLSRGQIKPIVVVAVPTNEARLQEYGAAVAANAQGLGREAAAYGRFVSQEVVPYVQAHYRVKREAAHTAVLGASLGGLSAFDLAWNYPDLFGIVGVMSGSFWWRASSTETAIDAGRRIAHSLVRRGPKRPGLRFWFQAATQDELDDRDQNGVIDAIQDTQELMALLADLGYRPEKDMVYVEVAGGRHNYGTWAAVLPHFLRWAFAA